MIVSMQRTVVETDGQSYCVCTERDIRGQATYWAIQHGGWNAPWEQGTSVLEATRAGLAAIAERLRAQQVTRVRSEVSCEMLSYEQVSEVVASELGECVPIVEF